MEQTAVAEWGGVEQTAEWGGMGWSTQLLLCGSGWDGADSCGHAVCE